MYGKMQESGLTEIMSLICTLTICSQYPIFLHLEPPQDAYLGVDAVLVA